MLTGDSPNSCSVLPQKWKPKLIPALPSATIHKPCRKHAVGPFERVLWGFVVTFLIYLGNLSAIVPTKCPIVIW